MLSIFRRLIHSRLGVFIGLGFILLIGLAFAAGDITGTGGLGQLGGGGDTVAKVGGRKLASAELSQRVQKVYDTQRRQQPDITMPDLLDRGIVEQMTDQLVTGLAVLGFSDDVGMAVSKRMVDGEIARIPAFRNATGQFDQALYQRLLQQEGISEKAIRADVERELAANQLLNPIAFGVKLPDDLVLPYASLLLEVRKGRAAALPSAAFIPTTPPDTRAVANWYAKNSRRFEIPEQRAFRYAMIDATRFDKAAEPNDAEVAAYYQKNAGRFAASEKRSLVQLIVPTEAAGKAIMAKVSGGKTLAVAAKEAGLSTLAITSVDRAALARQTSSQAAAAAFAAETGKLAGPFKVGLGWAVLEVSAIQKQPARNLAEARGEIVQALRAEKRHSLLVDFTGKLEDQSQDGATFEELVKDFGLSVVNVSPLVKDGRNVNDVGFQPSDEIKTLMAPVFEAEADGDPILATVAADTRYALVDVVSVIPAAPPPLAKVKDVATREYLLEQGQKRASAAAEAIVAKVKRGQDLAAAIGELKLKLPTIDTIGAQRIELMRAGQNAPEPLVLLFSLPANGIRALPLPDNRGVFLVKLDSLQHGSAGKRRDLVEATRGELSKVMGAEYGQQFGRAIEAELGVKRYPDAIIKVKQQLRRANGQGAQ